MGIYYKTNTIKTKKGMTTMLIHCSSCTNERAWHLIQSTNWFCLLVIPIFPTSSYKYIECPCCGKRIDINKRNKERIDRLFDKAIFGSVKVYYMHELL